jgi:hypothetical protein
MRYITLVHQNATASNGLAQEDDDGPSLPAKEALAGSRIVDVANAERAEEISAGCPDAQHSGMEIRALMHGGGQEG